MDIFNELKKTAARGVSIRVVQGPPSSTYPNNDTRELANMRAISLRSLNMSQLLGAGIIHTKMWIVDNEHFYIGSANMDWRSLTQVSSQSTAILIIPNSRILVRCLCSCR